MWLPMGIAAVVVLVLIALVLRLRASETRARRHGHALAEAEGIARLGSYRLDVASWEATWSDGMYHLLGLEPGDGQPSYERFLGYVHDEDRDRFDAAVRSGVRVTEGFDADCRLLVPGCGERIVQGRGEAIRGRGGNVVAVVGTVQDVTELRRNEHELAHRALHDPITDVANRRAVEAFVTEALAAGRPVAALVVNVRGFRGITRALGHETGDRLLRAVADRLTRVPGAAMVGRLGGDRFVIVVDPAPDTENAVGVAEAVTDALEPPLVMDELTLLVEASIGIAMAPGHAGDAAGLLRAAEAASARASERSSRHALFNPDADESGRGAHALLAAVRTAIAAGDIELHYQPKLSLEDGEIVGVEALVRWRRGAELVPPGEFLPQVERSGLIRELTLSVLETAAADCARWRSVGLDLTVAVNLSPPNLLDLGIADDIAGVLRACALPPDALELELTESALMVDRMGASGVLGALRTLGASLAIDDFGTGYSSLALLRELPVDTLKIDRSFVSGMGTGRGDEAIVRSVVALGRDLGLTVVGEGVETPAELDALAEFGCDVAQGFLIARPVPATDVARVIDDWEARASRPGSSGARGSR
jgi:diguanylate cyclase (GGDEF)-like protein